MPLANPATSLTTANQAAIISYSQRSTRPGPGPCHRRNAGPMLLADDKVGAPPRLRSRTRAAMQDNCWLSIRVPGTLPEDPVTTASLKDS